MAYSSILDHTMLFKGREAVGPEQPHDMGTMTRDDLHHILAQASSLYGLLPEDQEAMRRGVHDFSYRMLSLDKHEKVVLQPRMRYDGSIDLSSHKSMYDVGKAVAQEVFLSPSRKSVLLRHPEGFPSNGGPWDVDPQFLDLEKLSTALSKRRVFPANGTRPSNSREDLLASLAALKRLPDYFEKAGML